MMDTEMKFPTWSPVLWKPHVVCMPPLVQFQSRTANDRSYARKISGGAKIKESPHLKALDATKNEQWLYYLPLFSIYFNVQCTTNDQT